jgi:predicted amidohydrolase
MKNLKVATAQFESRSGDKEYNLSIIAGLAAKAAEAGADVIATHECSITGYSHARRLSREELWELAEPVPDGASVQRLIEIARASDIVVLAGLFEQGADGKIYKPYVCVDKHGLVARFRKLHPFINPLIKTGFVYLVLDLV